MRVAVHELVPAVDFYDADEQQHGQVAPEHVIMVLPQLAQHAQRDLRTAQLAHHHRRHVVAAEAGVSREPPA